MKRIGLLALLLALALETGAVAQSPSPEVTPPFVGRVELPEQGLAVNIPEGWVGLDPSGDLDEQLAEVEGWMDEAGPPTPTDGLRSLWESSRRGNVPVFLTRLDGAQTICLIQPSAQLPPDTVVPREMLEPVVRNIHARLKEGEAWQDVGDLVTVDLPMGDAWVVTATQSVAGLAQTSYWVGHGEGVLWVLCQGSTRPQDDWLSVAEAIEPLPFPPAAAPADG